MLVGVKKNKQNGKGRGCARELSDVRGRSPNLLIRKGGRPCLVEGK